MNKAKKAYKSYYKDMKAAIGGRERVSWINSCLLKGVTGKTILDIGCGEGSFLEELRDAKNDVFGIDASQTGQLACRAKGIDCALIDISRETFPYADDMFDIVLCFETLEHIENPHHCIWEIKRVLKENGIFIVSIPNPKILHPYLYPGLFCFKNFKTFLEINSFRILNIKGWGQAVMWSRFVRYFKSRDNALAGYASALIHFLSRKRNLLMRKHIGTPLGCWHSYNFVCVNHKEDKTLLERIAEETCPDENSTG